MKTKLLHIIFILFLSLNLSGCLGAVSIRAQHSYSNKERSYTVLKKRCKVIKGKKICHNAKVTYYY